MIGLARALLAAAAGIAFLSCADGAGSRGAYAFLECLECDDAALADSLSGAQAVPALSRALLHGPDANARASMALQVAQSYSGVSGMPLDTYVRAGLHDYVVNHRIRAVRGLHLLARRGVSQASDALLAAADSLASGATAFEPVVMRALEVAVTTLRGDSLDARVIPTDFTLDSLRADASWIDFGDTVIVHSQSGPVFAPGTVVTLVGSPFGDRVLLDRWDDSVRLMAIGRAGWHALEIRPPQGPSWWREIFIRRVAYRAHSPIDAESLTTGMRAQRYIALRFDRDHFRVLRTGSDTVFRVGLAWADSAHVRVSWRRCTLPDSLVPQLPGADMVMGKVLSDGRALAGAIVEAQSPARSDTTDSAGRFSLASFDRGIHDLHVRAPGHRELTVGVPAGLPDTIVLHVAREGFPLRRQRVEVRAQLGKVGCVFLGLDLVAAPPSALPVILHLDAGGQAGSGALPVPR